MAVSTNPRRDPVWASQTTYGKWLPGGGYELEEWMPLWMVQELGRTDPSLAAMARAIRRGGLGSRTLEEAPVPARFTAEQKIKREFAGAYWTAKPDIVVTAGNKALVGDHKILQAESSGEFYSKVKARREKYVPQLSAGREAYARRNEGSSPEVIQEELERISVGTIFYSERVRKFIEQVLLENPNAGPRIHTELARGTDAWMALDDEGKQAAVSSAIEKLDWQDPQLKKAAEAAGVPREVVFAGALPWTEEQLRPAAEAIRARSEMSRGVFAGMAHGKLTSIWSGSNAVRPPEDQAEIDFWVDLVKTYNVAAQGYAQGLPLQSSQRRINEVYERHGKSFSGDLRQMAKKSAGITPSGAQREDYMAGYGRQLIDTRDWEPIKGWHENLRLNRKTGEIGVIHHEPDTDFPTLYLKLPIRTMDNSELQASDLAAQKLVVAGRFVTPLEAENLRDPYTPSGDIEPAELLLPRVFGKAANTILQGHGTRNAVEDAREHLNNYFSRMPSASSHFLSTTTARLRKQVASITRQKHPARQIIDTLTSLQVPVPGTSQVVDIRSLFSPSWLHDPRKSEIYGPGHKLKRAKQWIRDEILRFASIDEHGELQLDPERSFVSPLLPRGAPTEEHPLGTPWEQGAELLSRARVAMMGVDVLPEGASIIDLPYAREEQSMIISDSVEVPGSAQFIASGETLWTEDKQGKGYYIGDMPDGTKVRWNKAKFNDLELLSTNVARHGGMTRLEFTAIAKIDAMRGTMKNWQPSKSQGAPGDMELFLEQNPWFEKDRPEMLLPYRKMGQDMAYMQLSLAYSGLVDKEKTPEALAQLIYGKEWEQHFVKAGHATKREKMLHRMLGRKGMGQVLMPVTEEQRRKYHELALGEADKMARLGSVRMPLTEFDIEILGQGGMPYTVVEKLPGGNVLADVGNDSIPFLVGEMGVLTGIEYPGQAKLSFEELTHMLVTPEGKGVQQAMLSKVLPDLARSGGHVQSVYRDILTARFLTTGEGGNITDIPADRIVSLEELKSQIGTYSATSFAGKITAAAGNRFIRIGDTLTLPTGDSLEMLRVNQDIKNWLYYEEKGGEGEQKNIQARDIGSMFNALMGVADKGVDDSDAFTRLWKSFVGEEGLSMTRAVERGATSLKLTRGATEGPAVTYPGMPIDMVILGDEAMNEAFGEGVSRRAVVAALQRRPITDPWAQAMAKAMVLSPKQARAMGVTQVPDDFQGIAVSGAAMMQQFGDFDGDRIMAVMLASIAGQAGDKEAISDPVIQAAATRLNSYRRWAESMAHHMGYENLSDVPGFEDIRPGELTARHVVSLNEMVGPELSEVSKYTGGMRKLMSRFQELGGSVAQHFLGTHEEMQEKTKYTAYAEKVRQEALGKEDIPQAYNRFIRDALGMAAAVPGSVSRWMRERLGFLAYQSTVDIHGLSQGVRDMVDLSSGYNPYRHVWRKGERGGGAWGPAPSWIRRYAPTVEGKTLTQRLPLVAGVDDYSVTLIDAIMKADEFWRPPEGKEQEWNAQGLLDAQAAAITSDPELQVQVRDAIAAGSSAQEIMDEVFGDGGALDPMERASRLHSAPGFLVSLMSARPFAAAQRSMSQGASAEQREQWAAFKEAAPQVKRTAELAKTLDATVKLLGGYSGNKLSGILEILPDFTGASGDPEASRNLLSRLLGPLLGKQAPRGQRPGREISMEGAADKDLSEFIREMVWKWNITDTERLAEQHERAIGGLRTPTGEPPPRLEIEELEHTRIRGPGHVVGSGSDDPAVYLEEYMRLRGDPHFPSRTEPGKESAEHNLYMISEEQALLLQVIDGMGSADAATVRKNLLSMQEAGLTQGVFERFVEFLGQHGIEPLEAVRQVAIRAGEFEAGPAVVGKLLLAQSGGAERAFRDVARDIGLDVPAAPLQRSTRTPRPAEKIQVGGNLPREPLEEAGRGMVGALRGMINQIFELIPEAEGERQLTLEQRGISEALAGLTEPEAAARLVEETMAGNVPSKAIAEHLVGMRGFQELKPSAVRSAISEAGRARRIGLAGEEATARQASILQERGLIPEERVTTTQRITSLLGSMEGVTTRLTEMDDIIQNLNPSAAEFGGQLETLSKYTTYESRLGTVAGQLETGKITQERAQAEVLMAEQKLGTGLEAPPGPTRFEQLAGRSRASRDDILGSLAAGDISKTEATSLMVKATGRRLTTEEREGLSYLTEVQPAMASVRGRRSAQARAAGMMAPPEPEPTPESRFAAFQEVNRTTFEDVSNAAYYQELRGIGLSKTLASGIATGGTLTQAQAFALVDELGEGGVGIYEDLEGAGLIGKRRQPAPTQQPAKEEPLPESLQVLQAGMVPFGAHEILAAGLGATPAGAERRPGARRAAREEWEPTALQVMQGTLTQPLTEEEWQEQLDPALRVMSPLTEWDPTTTETARGQEAESRGRQRAPRRTQAARPGMPDWMAVMHGVTPGERPAATSKMTQEELLQNVQGYMEAEVGETWGEADFAKTFVGLSQLGLGKTAATALAKGAAGMKPSEAGVLQYAGETGDIPGTQSLLTLLGGTAPEDTRTLRDNLKGLGASVKAVDGAFEALEGPVKRITELTEKESLTKQETAELMNLGELMTDYQKGLAGVVKKGERGELAEGPDLVNAMVSGLREQFERQVEEGVPESPSPGLTGRIEGFLGKVTSGFGLFYAQRMMRLGTGLMQRGMGEYAERATGAQQALWGAGEEAWYTPQMQDWLVSQQRMGGGMARVGRGAMAAWSDEYAGLSDIAGSEIGGWVANALLPGLGAGMMAMFAGGGPWGGAAVGLGATAGLTMNYAGGQAKPDQLIANYLERTRQGKEGPGFFSELGLRISPPSQEELEPYRDIIPEVTLTQEERDKARARGLMAGRAGTGPEAIEWAEDQALRAKMADLAGETGSKMASQLIDAQLAGFEDAIPIVQNLAMGTVISQVSERTGAGRGPTGQAVGLLTGLIGKAPPGLSGTWAQAITMGGQPLERMMRERTIAGQPEFAPPEARTRMVSDEQGRRVEETYYPGLEEAAAPLSPIETAQQEAWAGIIKPVRQAQRYAGAFDQETEQYFSALREMYESGIEGTADIATILTGWEGEVLQARTTGYEFATPPSPEQFETAEQAFQAYQQWQFGAGQITGLGTTLQGMGVAPTRATAAANVFAEQPGEARMFGRFQQGDPWAISRYAQGSGNIFDPSAPMAGRFQAATAQMFGGEIPPEVAEVMRDLRPIIDTQTGLKVGIASFPGFSEQLAEGMRIAEQQGPGARGAISIPGGGTLPDWVQDIIEQGGTRDLQIEQIQTQRGYQEWQQGQRGQALDWQRVSQFGGQFEGLDTRGTFAIQRELRNLGRLWADFTTDFQEQQRQLQYGQFMENWQVRAERAPVGFQWQREDIAFKGAQQTMQYGWGQEDIEEALRYATGRERRKLLRQQERATIQYGMGMGQLGVQEERIGVREQWSQEDLEREKRHFLERFALQDEYQSKYRWYMEQRRELEDELQAIHEFGAMFNLEQAETALAKQVEIQARLNAINDGYLAVNMTMENNVALAQLFANLSQDALAAQIAASQAQIRAAREAASSYAMVISYGQEEF